MPTQAALPDAGWVVENAPMPLSSPRAGAVPIGLDRAMEIARPDG